jgi:uncharacterized protein (DUF2345 family)
MEENMADENKPVFNEKTEIPTANKVPKAGTDNHIDIAMSSGQWDVITNSTFISDFAAGQDQDLIRSADHVVQVQKNQLVNIGEAQKTTANREITITSTEKHIHVKAATNIVLEVGKSKITMTVDGKIEIAGVEIKITGDTILSKATSQNTVIGAMVDINP